MNALAAALYDPIWTSAVRHPLDLGVPLAGFALLAAFRLSPLVVALCVAASLVIGVIGAG